MDQYHHARLDRELICQAARIGLFWQWLLHQRARIFATLQDSRRRQRSRFYRQHVEHYVRHGIPDWSRRLYANGFLALWHQVPDTIPGVSASTPFISAGFWRGTGAIYFITAASVQCCSAYASAQWYQDVVTKSTFSGTISGSVLTLSANAVGPMWEGEIIGGAGLSGGVYITGLTGGLWGASGSTYTLGGASGVSFTGAMQNAVYYQGAGPGIYAGALNDDVTQAGSDVPGGLAVALGYAPHPGTGFAGGRRLGSRLGCLVWGGLTNPANCSSPTIDRTKADAGGCDTASIAAPCLDIGNTYAA